MGGSVGRLFAICKGQTKEGFTQSTDDDMAKENDLFEIVTFLPMINKRQFRDNLLENFTCMLITLAQELLVWAFGVFF